MFLALDKTHHRHIQLAVEQKLLNGTAVRDGEGHVNARVMGVESTEQWRHHVGTRAVARTYQQLAAFREGAGKDMDILVDLNFNYKTEGYLKVARAMEPFDLFWVEMDIRNPAALHYIRSRTTIPVASGESLFGRRAPAPTARAARRRCG